MTSDLRAALADRLDADGERWLSTSVQQVQSDPASLAGLFPAAGRRCGRAPLDQPAGWTVEDAVRALLLLALPLSGQDLVAELETAYRHGDAAERHVARRQDDDGTPALQGRGRPRERPARSGARDPVEALGAEAAANEVGERVPQERARTGPFILFPNTPCKEVIPS